MLIKPDEWDHGEVPRQIMNQVCGPYKCVASNGERMITDYEDVLGGARYSRLPRHSKCGRPSFTFVYRCDSCLRVFIRDFSHPRFCPIHTCCWTCVSEVSRSSCTDDCNRIKSFHVEMWGVWGPTGLNPKEFSSNELNETLRELGLDFQL